MSTDDSVDIVFSVSWTHMNENNEQMLDKYLQKCVNNKFDSQEGI